MTCPAQLPRNFRDSAWLYRSWSEPGASARHLGPIIPARDFLRGRDWRCALAVLALAALATAVEPPFVSAADEPDGPDAAVLFQQLDANSDGFVTAGEVSEEKQRLLARLLRIADADKDGKLSKDEFVAGLKTSRPERAGGQPGVRPWRRRFRSRRVLHPHGP